ncbi:MAG TPA: fumarylacetoacetate hydrolase family protein [Acidothermaceae bacterium]
MSADTARLRSGMRVQLARRDDAAREGVRQVGWKLGFGSPSGLELLGLDRPLVGFLLETGLLPDAALVDIAGWTQPVLEPEIAVHLGQRVEPDASWDDVRAAIRGYSAAIELADLDRPPRDVHEVLAGNIFHRCFIVGTIHTEVLTAADLAISASIDGREVASTRAPQELTGEVIEILRLTAEGLATYGESLRAGDVVLTGSAVPPLQVTAGMHVGTQTDRLGPLTVSLI